MMQTFSSPRIDLPTLALVLLCYTAFAVSTTVLAVVFPVAGFLLLVLATTLHSSLQHEILHGHLSRNRFFAIGTIFPAIGLFIPYERFKDTHLQHHQDETLTDPYDDPESNFLDPKEWAALSSWKKTFYRFNNTLCGRMMIGPAIGLYSFWRKDLIAMARGDQTVRRAYLLHLLGIMPVGLWLISYGQMPFWLYLLGCYGGISLLKVRTFLEHRAHDEVPGRSAIVEDRSFLSLLFLNNNLHALHHQRPDLRWYELPEVYAAQRDEILKENDQYFYQSYREIFRHYFFKAKDNIPHPLIKP